MISMERLHQKLCKNIPCFLKLGLSPKSFWDSINEESKRTGGETMMVFMRHLLDQAKEKNIKISKNEFFQNGEGY